MDAVPSLLAAALVRALGSHGGAPQLAPALELLRANTNPASGRTGFSRTGGPMSRVTPKQDEYPGVLSEQPTAMRWLARVALRELVETDTSVATGSCTALAGKIDYRGNDVVVSAFLDVLQGTCPENPLPLDA